MKSDASRRIVLACLLTLAGCEKKPQESPAAAERPAALVSVAATTESDVPVYLDEIGRCSARELVALQPQVSGRITQIHFVDGVDLKAGDLLFTIDPRPFQAQLAAAEAALAQSKAALDLAKVEFTRVSGLVEKKAAAQQEFDTAKNAVAVSEARLQQNQAAVQTARLNVEYSTLRAPIEGRAGRRIVDVGNNVKENDTTLLIIQRMDPIYADFSVTERDLSTVQKSIAKGPLRAEVRIPDEADAPRLGDVTFVDNAVQEGTGTVLLRATLANADRHLWPGRFVKVRIILDTLKGAVLVPAAAIQMSAKGPYVYVVKGDSTAEFRPIQPGQRHDDRVVVPSGVKAGERVVTAGFMGIMPGGKVKVAAPPAPDSASGKEPGK
ncbi:MAG TPA: efflux RND transporter periplasmic adaptor subunit [Planctomycetota bacterium]|nr:efflux RND transporter periplasmic adaptor subunit [Planctomycetota bacterium]